VSVDWARVGGLLVFAVCSIALVRAGEARFVVVLAGVAIVVAGARWWLRRRA